MRMKGMMVGPRYLLGGWRRVGGVEFTRAEYNPKLWRKHGSDQGEGPGFCEEALRAHFWAGVIKLRFGELGRLGHTLEIPRTCIVVRALFIISIPYIAIKPTHAIR